MEGGGDFFTEKAKTWDKIEWAKERAQRTTELVVRELGGGEKAKEAKVLDFGCGTGSLCLSLAEKVGSVVGVDAAEGMVSEFEKKLDQLKSVDNVVAEWATISSFSAREAEQGRYDVVLSVFTFHHVEDRKAVLQEVRRLLKPNGYALIVDLLETPNSMLFHSSHAHKHGGVHKSGGFSAAELTDLFQAAGYPIVSTETLFDFQKPVEPDNSSQTFSVIAAVGRTM
mmetsp:Transcript_26482/g.74015  ORF Transcript_26482/g.74015 Transcript_26482/m.74015 type:complete len:226 (+) Transcript_26482:158-835(+)